MRASREDGFVLVTALWFLALLALISVIVAGWISTALNRAITLRDRASAQAALIGVTDRLALVMVSGGYSSRGLELVPISGVADSGQPWTAGSGPAPDNPFIALDGRPYRVGSIVVRLFDEGGLYDLSSPSHDTLSKLLKNYGIVSSDIDAMTVALAAYEKPSDTRTEIIHDADYLQARLPLPRHTPLVTPWELYRVLGWARAEALWRGPTPFTDTVTLGPVAGLNLNTAPVQVLAAVTGMDDQAVARLVASRAGHPLTSLRELEPGADLTQTEDRPIAFVPSNIIRLKVTQAGDPLVHIISIRLTPLGPAPYRIDFAVDMPQDDSSRALADSGRLAELPILPNAP